MPETENVKPARLLSLDAFRGAIMLLMASAGLNLARVAERYPDSGVWQFIKYQTDHVTWTGCSLWDVIQPAFMFMVGTAMAWSIANRKARGESFGKLLGHALLRAVLLVALSIFLQSNGGSVKRTDWTFPNVLAQIGFGYPFLFLISFTRPMVQWIAAFAILFFYWLAFALHPLPQAGFDWSTVGVDGKWERLTGFAAHWDKNYNFAATFDRWFLNLFPRSQPFVFNNGGYQTLNFIPSIATMIFGLRAGALLRGELPLTQKLRRMVIFGALGMALGAAIHYAGLCPIVKKIWTPSWAIYSAGLVALLLAGFVAVIDLAGLKKWTLPLVVVGMNPITLYVMFQIMAGWIRETVAKHSWPNLFDSAGPAGPVWALILQRLVPLVVMWLIVWWMYQAEDFYPDMKRIRFQFSLRTLMLGVLAYGVVSLLTLWGGGAAVAEQQALKAQWIPRHWHARPVAAAPFVVVWCWRCDDGRSMIGDTVFWMPGCTRVLKSGDDPSINFTTASIF